MKQEPEDPRPTAFLLGEMDADEAAAFQLAAAAAPELQAALRDRAALHENLTQSLIIEPERLTPSQRATILQGARKIDRTTKISPINVHRRRRKPWPLFLATAAAVLLAVLVISRVPRPAPEQANEPSSAPQPPRDHLIQPAPDPQAVAASTTDSQPTATDAPPAISTDLEIPALPTRESLTVAASPTLQLPIHPGKSSLPWITQSIREEHQLPPPESIRLDELLNSFPIRLKGITAVARIAKSSWHPDTREAGMSTHAATMASETIACPWKPSAKLLLISIRGNPTDDCEARVVFRPNATHVFRYRLLGFPPIPGRPPGIMPTRLAASSARTLVIEIDPSSAAGELGTIEWTVNGQPAAGIPVTRNADAEPSDDARFAALVCTYAQWLAGEQGGIIDTALLAALGREIDSETLSAERTDFLKLISQSLRL